MIPSSLMNRGKLATMLFSQNHSNVPADLVVCVMYEDEKAYSAKVEDAVEFCRYLYYWEWAFGFISLAIGVPGNIMAAVTSLSMDTAVSSTYIFVLAVGDLFTLLARCATPTTNKLAFETAKRVVSFIPNSTLVLICFERYMAVSHPWKRRMYITLKFGYWSVAGIVVFNFFILLICVSAANDTEVSRSGVNLLIAFLIIGLPCPFIIILNTLTILNLHQINTAQQQSSVQHKLWSQIEASITYMMIIASVVFLTLNGPQLGACFYWFIADIVSGGDSMMNHTRLTFVLNLTYLLTLIHHSINFYVYVLGTKRFRLQFLQLVQRMDRTSKLRMSTTHSSEIIDETPESKSLLW